MSTPTISQCALCAKYFQAETQEKATRAAKQHEAAEMDDFNVRLDHHMSMRSAEGRDREVSTDE